MLFMRSVLLLSVAAFGFVSSGCSQRATESDTGSTPNTQASNDDPTHGGWWCVEHGIPEKECSLCSRKAAEQCKAQGDWCEEHNRAESQCFICDASRAERFTKLYEAKIGESPPKWDESSDGPAH